MTYKLTLPAPRDDLYSIVTVAGLSLFLSVELVYFLFSNPPSFHMPSVDAFGGTAIQHRQSVLVRHRTLVPEHAR